MLDQDKIYPNQPLDLEIDTQQDLTEASATTIELRWPDGSITHETATVTETTKLTTTIAKDRLVAGTYRAQGKADWGNGACLGETEVFKVSEEWK